MRGRKAFVAMAPAATVLNVAVSYEDEEGVERHGFASIPPRAEGVEIHDDWEALGMRASASGLVSFHGVQLDPEQVHDGFPVGVFGLEMHDRYLESGAFHGSASPGIAEAAHDHVLTRLRSHPDTVLADAHATCAPPRT